MKYEYVDTANARVVLHFEDDGLRIYRDGGPIYREDALYDSVIHDLVTRIKELEFEAQQPEAYIGPAKSESLHEKLASRLEDACPDVADPVMDNLCRDLATILRGES